MTAFTPVTPADVEAVISSEHYFTALNGVFGSEVATAESTHSDLPDVFPEDIECLDLLTFCVLVTNNGHTVTGEAHCQDPAKFDAETGRQAARKNAIEKLWPMVVYAAREKAAS